MLNPKGFGGFNSTAGRYVDDENANVSAIYKKTTRRALVVRVKGSGVRG
jgi:U4/U6.U5 tri-snRNP-associated protein 3